MPTGVRVKSLRALSGQSTPVTPNQSRGAQRQTPRIHDKHNAVWSTACTDRPAVIKDQKSLETCPSVAPLSSNRGPLFLERTYRSSGRDIERAPSRKSGEERNSIHHSGKSWLLRQGRPNRQACAHRKATELVKGATNRERQGL
jgi:hypothetical protein